MSKGQFTNHTFIVSKDIVTNKQSFYAFGQNQYQQQGFALMDNTENIYRYLPTLVPTLNEIFTNIEIIQISTGHQHSLFLTSAGKVYACGRNDGGECGVKIEENSDNDHCIKPQLVLTKCRHILADFPRFNTFFYASCSKICVDFVGVSPFFG